MGEGGETTPKVREPEDYYPKTLLDQERNGHVPTVPVKGEEQERDYRDQLRLDRKKKWENQTGADPEVSSLDPTEDTPAVELPVPKQEDIAKVLTEVISQSIRPIKKNGKVSFQFDNELFIYHWNNTYKDMRDKKDELTPDEKNIKVAMEALEKMGVTNHQENELYNHREGYRGQHTYTIGEQFISDIEKIGQRQAGYFNKLMTKLSGKEKTDFNTWSKALPDKKAKDIHVVSDTNVVSATQSIENMMNLMREKERGFDHRYGERTNKFKEFFKKLPSWMYEMHHTAITNVAKTWRDKLLETKPNQTPQR
ncbi:hypothetical protein EDM53_04490 [Rickettsiales endosymbiont of Peranema trichophorum]|uniref:hypothetical protein n=1 Tax=Rickettsiales endosymbiont of Peranema trichophorum TaxID=2486577 RepID=UPI001023F35D|nr:hypothetical protein [Rickettsiales endosymbiont of Peranema trichophorum]RZI45987.1 hypothetical protein EDM53_04490 [Rickettsiales endosymbiont of Peranema trichophorum]